MRSRRRARQHTNSSRSAPTRRAEEAWAAHNRETAEETLYTTADSHYRGANIPGKPTVFTLYAGGVDTYHDVIREVADRDYEGFALADSVADLGRTGKTPRRALSTVDGRAPRGGVCRAGSGRFNTGRRGGFDVFRSIDRARRGWTHTPGEPRPAGRAWR